MMNYRYMPFWVEVQVRQLKSWDYKIAKIYRDKYSPLIYLEAEDPGCPKDNRKCAYIYNLVELSIEKVYFNQDRKLYKQFCSLRD